jgi:hypothetical protein
MGPETSKLEPHSQGEENIGYDPQGTGMDHDSVFASFAPGVARSGSLAHKWGPEGDHTNVAEPPTGLKGD